MPSGSLVGSLQTPLCNRISSSGLSRWLLGKETMRFKVGLQRWTNPAGMQTHPFSQRLCLGEESKCWWRPFPNRAMCFYAFKYNDPVHPPRDSLSLRFQVGLQRLVVPGAGWLLLPLAIASQSEARTRKLWQRSATAVWLMAFHRSHLRSSNDLFGRLADGLSP